MPALSLLCHPVYRGTTEGLGSSHSSYLTRRPPVPGEGSTLRLLGRQLPLLPPPPLGASGQHSVAKDVALRRAMLHDYQRCPMLHDYQRCPKENFVHFAPQHYP